MKHIYKICTISFFCLLVSFINSVMIRADVESPPDPRPVENLLHLDEPDHKRGTWYIGATPPEAEKSLPPIVFVQGLTGRAHEWWGNTDYHGPNDMYELAYKNGYRTAFVELYDESRGPLDQFENGMLLAKMLKQIYAHFKGQKVNVVAHSKGGVDTQTALIYYDAHQFVNKVISIGSPHYGCDLADLFHSWYGSWLNKVLGTEGKGTYAMQRGNMLKFREKTDRHPNIAKNKYFTASGTNWGPSGSLLWCGGYYLSYFGENDGLIGERCTHLPGYATHLFTADFDHDLLRKGSAIWGGIEPVLSGRPIRLGSDLLNRFVGRYLSSVYANSKADVARSAPKESEQVVSGGEVAQGELEEKEVVVESSRQALFTMYSKSLGVDVSLISPSGIRYTRESTQYKAFIGREIFSGAIAQTFRITQPEVGKWKIQLRSKQKDAYILTVSFDKENRYLLDVPPIAKGNAVPVKIQVNDKGDVISIRMKMVDPDQKLEVKQLDVSDSSQSGKKEWVRGNIPLGKRRGLYNVLFEIRQKTQTGVIERTVSRSIYMK